jgi:asparagine synthase (glutamine-hydrolysing)
MCGIVGIFDTVGRHRVGLDTMQRLIAAVAHRGPDDCGQLIEDNIGLGFRRLSIVDPEGGHQPMWSETGSVVSICNGEIYNAPDLRERLQQKGHRFTTRCDMEVLPHLYEEQGTDLVDALDGQFAFAIYDKARRRLFAARDHFGVVPFFYTHIEGLFLFASEIKALLEHPAVTRRVNLTGLDQIVCFPGLVSPTTMFDGIESLPSGHCLVVSDAGLARREYWDLNYPLAGVAPVEADEGYYLEGAREHLRRSVKKRLMSDVPIGLYLSGGLDSSAIAALAHREQPATSWHSFGVSFKGDEMCESRYQQSVATFVGTIHHDVPFGPCDVADGLERTVFHAECPVKESYDTTCLALSRTAKDAGVSVILTGQGADELFGGYIGYRFDQFSRPAAAPQPDDATEQVIRDRLWGDPTFAYDLGYTQLQSLKQRVYSKAVRAELPAHDCLLSSSLRKDRVAGRHILHKRSYLDFKLRLADHLLADHGDRMAMAHAVEIRHPFLDVDLVKFVAAIPPRIQLKDPAGKYVLRQAAASLVPPAIVTRDKFGWFAHGSPQLLRAGSVAVRELLSPDRIRRHGYFDPRAVEQMVTRYSRADFRLSQPFESDLLMLVLSFTAFVDIFKMPHLN